MRNLQTADISGNSPIKMAKFSAQDVPSLLHRDIFGSNISLSKRNRQAEEVKVDFWAVLLIFAFMAGIMGWTITPFINAVLWYCDWRDGIDINWGMDTVFTIACPFAWMFAIFEIIILYSK